MEEEMEARVRDTEREMEEMKRTWEEKLKQAQVSYVIKKYFILLWICKVNDTDKLISSLEGQWIRLIYMCRIFLE